MAQNNRTGTGFTNISNILNANAGNRLAQGVAQRISDVGTRASGDISKAYSDFQTQADTADTTSADKQKAQDLLSKYSEPQAKAAGVSTPSTSEGISPSQDTGFFQNIRQGSYQGPQNIQNYQDLQNQAQRAKSFGQMSQTGTGRQQLLRQTVANPAYTQGQNRLDTLLLGQGEQAPLSAARRTTQNLAQVAGDVQTQAQNYAQQKAQNFEKLKSDVFGQSGLIAGAQGTISDAVKQQYNAARQAEAQKQALARFTTGYATGQQNTLDTSEIAKSNPDLDLSKFKVENGKIIGTNLATDENLLVKDFAGNVIGVKANASDSKPIQTTVPGSPYDRSAISPEGLKAGFKTFTDKLIASGIDPKIVEEMYGSPENYDKNIQAMIANQNLNMVNALQNQLSKQRGYDFWDVLNSRYLGNFDKYVTGELTPQQRELLKMQGLGDFSKAGSLYNYLWGNTWYNNLFNNLAGKYQTELEQTGKPQGIFSTNETMTPDSVLSRSYQQVADQLNKQLADLNPNTFSEEMVATPEQKQRFAALQQFMGTPSAEQKYKDITSPGYTVKPIKLTPPV